MRLTSLEGNETIQRNAGPTAQLDEAQGSAWRLDMTEYLE